MEQAMADPGLTKMWARIQEGLLNLIDHATALEQMMDRNPTAALNPARAAMSRSLDRHIAAARNELEQIEREMSVAERDMLAAELEDVRRKRKARAV
jgi:hypothetical protein